MPSRKILTSEDTEFKRQAAEIVLEPNRIAGLKGVFCDIEISGPDSETVLSKPHAFSYLTI